MSPTYGQHASRIYRSDEVRSGDPIIVLGDAAMRSNGFLCCTCRNKAYLAVFSFLHVFSAVSLSSGFTVLIHKSYKAVFRFPIPPEWKTYCPPHLQVCITVDFASSEYQRGFLQLPQDLCDYAESSLSLQQMMFFLGVGESLTCGHSMKLSSPILCFELLSSLLNIFLRFQ